MYLKKACSSFVCFIEGKKEQSWVAWDLVGGTEMVPYGLSSRAVCLSLCCWNCPSVQPYRGDRYWFKLQTPRRWKSLCCVWLFATAWTVARQAPLCMDPLVRLLQWAISSSWDLLTQGSNPGLLHCRQILYLLSPQGSSPGGLRPCVSHSLWTAPRAGLWVCRPSTGISFHAQADLLNSLMPHVTLAALPRNFPVNTVLWVFDKKSDDFLKNVEFSFCNH